MMLQANHLTVEIANKIICRDLNWQVFAGEVWGILGANGSGKTTLLHTLAKLHDGFFGELFLRKNDIHSYTQKEISQQMGILLQDTQAHFPRSVFDYCIEGRYPHLSYFTRLSEADFSIAKIALQDMDLIAQADQNVQTLSGGERRRLAIATLLAQTPQVYLLDEPTNHLDWRHQVKVLNHFKSLAQHQANAVIMSLHDVHLAQQFCHKILMLFGDGSYLQGDTQQVLTVENLSRLYNCSVQWVKTLVPIL